MSTAFGRQIGAPPPPLFTWHRPRSYWDVVGRHLPLALISGIPLALSNWLPMKRLPLMPCTFLWLTDYPCPFCGFTRSFWAMAQGNWSFAFHNAPLACLLYVVSAVVFAWNATGLLLGFQIGLGPFFQRKPGGVRWITITVAFLVIINWVYRLALGLK
jgi:hypothetical protein